MPLKHQPGFAQLLAVGVVELKAVAVALADLLLGIGGRGVCARLEHAGIGAQPHGAAHVGNAALVGHQVDDGVGRVRIELGAVGPVGGEHMAGEFDTHDLHAQAEAKIRDVVLAGIAGGDNLALDAAIAEAARHYNAVGSCQPVERRGPAPGPRS